MLILKSGIWDCMFDNRHVYERVFTKHGRWTPFVKKTSRRKWLAKQPNQSVTDGTGRVKASVKSVFTW